MYTNKDKVRVVVFIGEWRIEGDLHVLAESRLTDALNAKTKEFLAITDAKIYDAKSGVLSHESKFIDVNRAQVSMIFAVD